MSAFPAVTVQTLITMALKAIGAIGEGQTARPSEIQDAFNALVMMIGSWQQRRWTIYQTIDVSLPSTGAESYTIGPGADFNVPRPTRIESGFFRQIPIGGTPVDRIMDVIQSREDYNRIPVKEIAAFPRYVFYDAGFPTGTLNFWPVPLAGIYQIHLTVVAQLQAFSTVNDVISLPPEYAEALWTNLAVRLGVLWRLPVDQDVKDLARSAFNTMTVANAQVPRLHLPAQLVGRGRYNIYSDQVI